MRKSALSWILGLASLLSGQNSGTSLTIVVKPEAHVSPTAAQLVFHVASPGVAATSEPVAFTAWVRSLPGQEIHLTARALRLTGPQGDAPVSALRWSGALAAAKGGAQGATCLSGTFANGADQPLIGGWRESGIATCSTTFALTTDSSWPEGDYFGQIQLDLSVR